MKQQGTSRRNARNIVQQSSRRLRLRISRPKQRNEATKEEEEEFSMIKHEAEKARKQNKTKQDS
jgi:hypothetical protein